MCGGIPDDCSMFSPSGRLFTGDLLRSSHCAKVLDVLGRSSEALLSAERIVGRGLVYELLGRAKGGFPFRLVVLPGTTFLTDCGPCDADDLTDKHILLPEHMYVVSVKRLYIGARFVNVKTDSDRFFIHEGMGIRTSGKDPRNERLPGNQPRTGG